jgi:hypothetical protein
VVIEGAGHHVSIEAPGRLNHELLAFVSDVGACMADTPCQVGVPNRV